MNAWKTPGFALLAVTLLHPAATAAELRVTLLGTGSPAAVMNRFGPSILVEAGPHKFLFDAGRGVAQRLNQAKVKWRDIDGVFFTHLHSDHVVGFPDLWLTSWLTEGRDVPLRVWGPRGTKSMTSHLEQAYEADIRIRLYDDHASPDGIVLLAEDIGEGVVFEQDGVRVTAFEVDHAPVKPAFGYRVDSGGRSVVLSGDTRPSENLVRHAQGVDVLIHEVASAESLARAGQPPERVKGIVAHHTTPEQAGELFSRVKPRLAGFSHIVHPAATEADLIVPARTAYAGPLELGEDLMVIEIGEKVTVHRPARSTP